MTPTPDGAAIIRALIVCACLGGAAWIAALGGCWAAFKGVM